MHWLIWTFWLVDYTVAPVGGDFTSIQDALDAAFAGDTIWVETAVYQEQVSFPRSGSTGAGPIRLLAALGHTPVLDGTPFVGGNMVLIQNRSYIEVGGFEIANLSQINDGSAIRVIGSGTDIRILHNHIHHMLGLHAMAITVYGTESTAISQIEISDNWVHDCEPSQSEAITLNGNVDGFTVANNLVTDVNNIGIDFIGGETSINPNPALVARNGVCRGNRVHRARSNYGGGYAAGIYVDGARDIVIEGNEVSESDLGIEVGAENAGTTSTGIKVRSNWIHHNDKVGIVFGGYDVSVGRVQDSFFVNNTCYLNDTLGEGVGELWIQYASQNTVRNNLFIGRSGQTIHYSEMGNSNNVLEYNLWFASGGQPEWIWKSLSYTSFAAFQTGSGQESMGTFEDPKLVDPENGDGHLQEDSPAINSGDPAALASVVGSVDFDGQARQVGIVDRGMDEVGDSASCLPTVYDWWRLNGPICGAPVATVPQFVALVNQTCSCPVP